MTSKMLSVALAAAIAFAAVGSARAQEKRALYVYTWLEYFDPLVVRSFEEAFDCRVEFDYFESVEDMFSTMTNESVSGYDLATPTSFMAKALWDRGLLLPLQKERIPNLANIDQAVLAFSHDSEMRYSAPYTINVTGIGYRRGMIDESELCTWRVFGDPRHAGRMTMLHDLRECLGIALKTMGHSLNSVDDDELARAGMLFREWKNNIAGFEVDADALGIEGESLAFSHSYSGDMVAIMARDPDVGFIVPDEGGSLTADDFVVPVGAEAIDLAHAFVNHMLEPENAKRNMEEVCYYMPIPRALAILDEELLANAAFNVPAEIVARCETIRDLGPDNEKYEAIWGKALLGE